MSKLSEMIATLCPNGVEYKKLGEIATDMYRGCGILRTQVTETGVPCVRYGEIYTAYGIWFDRCISHTKIEYVQSPKFIDKGDILFAITGESVEEIAKSTAYVGEERCLAGGDIVVMKHNQDPKYLSYALSTIDAQKQKSKGKVKSKVVHSSVPAIKEIEIPLPPLEIQREIVQILDNFANLTAELTAELAKRKKQYEHYRDMLLNFEGGGRYDNVSSKIEWKKLGEIATKISSGGTPKVGQPEYYDGNIPWLRTQEVDWNEIVETSMKITQIGLDNSSAKWIKPNCVIVAMYGATAGKVAINKIPLTTNQACCNIELNQNKAHYRYVFHWLCHRYLHLKSLGQGSQSNINAAIVRDYPIPLPPLAEQKRIVAILDRFDALCNSLSEGLPAEIELRRKQYEYYRDKLLSFKEAG